MQDKKSVKLSPKTEQMINNEGNTIIGSVTCPHCAKFGKFVNGQVEGYSLKLGKHGEVNLSSDWEELDRALQKTNKTKEVLEKVCSEKKGLNQEKCDEFSFITEEHIKELEFLKEKDIDFDKVRKKFNMVYMEDLSTFEQVSEIDKILNLETVPAIILSECGDKQGLCKRSGALDPVRMVLHDAIRNKDIARIEKVKSFLEDKRKRTIEHSKKHDNKEDFEKLQKYFQINSVDNMIKNWWKQEE